MKIKTKCDYLYKLRKYSFLKSPDKLKSPVVRIYWFGQYVYNGDILSISHELRSYFCNMKTTIWADYRQLNAGEWEGIIDII